ncbi:MULTISPECIES: acyltransferase [Shewanella]|uniref:acyltransferase n=1 Tax=Shewanella TaxID=22 RepID=UPI001AAFCE51|nr:acyltransferase [Shewanella algae]MBO2661848.1 acyltransferase [Shewanella algae]MCL1053028.1 acyltransferase [Shewanella algae]
MSFKKRLYCVPGLILSCMLSITPSFRLSTYILSLFNRNVSRSAKLHSGIRFVIPTRISIGEGSTINGGAFIDARCGIAIGNNTMVGRGVKIFTLGHDIHDPEFKSVGAKVTIGNNVVIFPYVIIMPGVSIGNNVVVYPGSVVTKNIEDNNVVAGVPAKYIKMRENMNYTLNYNSFFGV